MVRRVLFKLLQHASRTKRAFRLQISLIERFVTSLLDRTSITRDQDYVEDDLNIYFLLLDLKRNS